MMHLTVKVTNQCLEQLEALAHTKNPEPVVFRGNQLTTSALDIITCGKPVLQNLA